MMKRNILYMCCSFILILAGSLSYADEQSEGPKSTSIYEGYNQMWIDLGFGPGRVESRLAYNASLSASYYHPSGLYTLQMIYHAPEAKVRPAVYVSGPEPRELIRAEAYYGRAAKRKYGYLALSGGVSIMRLKYDTIHSGIKTTYHLGIPFMLHLFVTPLPDIGLGFKTNYVVSNLHPILNINFCVEIGILR